MIQLVKFNDGAPTDMSTNCILTPLNYILKNGEDGQFCFMWFFFHHAHRQKKKKQKQKFSEASGIKHLLLLPLVIKSVIFFFLRTFPGCQLIEPQSHSLSGITM